MHPRLGKVRATFRSWRVRSPTANPAILFAAIVLLALSFVLLLAMFGARLIQGADELTAVVLGRLLALTGVGVRTHQGLLVLSACGRTRQMRVGYGCDGVLAYAILASAILPFPCRFRAKLTGLAAGMVAVAVINQVRLLGLTVALFLVDAAQFRFWHYWPGQFFVILMVFLYWNAWSLRAIRQASGALVSPGRPESQDA